MFYRKLQKSVLKVLKIERIKKIYFMMIDDLSIFYFTFKEMDAPFYIPVTA